MQISALSPIKINLTLRISGRRPDGFHELRSIFWRKTGCERLTIRDNCAEIKGDTIGVAGAVIEGENILSRVMTAARRKRHDIPPLAMELEKHYPAGSGIGAGSGNAAALIGMLRKAYGVSFTADEIAAMGADTVFLASGLRIARASGVGEILKPADAAFDAKWLLIFPKWRSNTAEAYGKLDRLRERTGFAAGAEAEALDAEEKNILRLLESGAAAGRMPNDFYRILAEEHREYRGAEEAAGDSSALAWGLCGSGSAFFALYADSEKAAAASEIFKGKNWVLKTFCDME